MFQVLKSQFRFHVLFTTRPLGGVYVKQQHIHMSKIHKTGKTIRKKLHG